MDARRAPRRRRPRACPARSGADERARGEPRRGDPRRRSHRARQRDPAARQARRRPGRPRRGRSRKRGRRAARRRARVRGATGRRRVELARLRPPGSARPRGDERLLRAVPARRCAHAVRTRPGGAHAEEARREARRCRCSSRLASSRPSSSRTSRSAAARSSRPRSPIPAAARRPRPRWPGRDDRADRTSAVDKVACELDVSREELVLALRSEEAFESFSEEQGIEREEAEEAIATASCRRWTMPRRRARCPGLIAPFVRSAAESVPPWLVLEALERIGSFLP